MSIWMPDIEKIEAQLAAARAREEEAKTRRDSGGNGGQNFWGRVLRLNKLDHGEYVVRLLPTFRKEDDPEYRAFPFKRVERYKNLPPSGANAYNLRKMFPEVLKERKLKDLISDAIDGLFKAKYVSQWADFGAFPNQAPGRETTTYVNVQLVEGFPSELLAKAAPVMVLPLNKTQEDDFIAAVLKMHKKGKNVFDPKVGRVLEMGKRAGADGKTKWGFTFGDEQALADTDEEIAKILADQPNLDKQFRFPSDEMLADYEQYAADITEYFAEKAKAAKPNASKGTAAARASRVRSRAASPAPNAEPVNLSELWGGAGEEEGPSAAA